LFKFTIEKVFKTGLVVLIQYCQSMPWLCYASPCPISHGTLPALWQTATQSASHVAVAITALTMLRR